MSAPVEPAKTPVQCLLGLPLVRFMCSGAAAAVVDVAVFAFLNLGLAWPGLACNAVSRPSGGAVSFWVNKRWTFRHSEWRGTGREALRYLMLWLASFTLSGAILVAYRWILPAWSGADLVAKAAAEVTLGLISFGTQRCWVFRPPKAS